MVRIHPGLSIAVLTVWHRLVSSVQSVETTANATDADARDAADTAPKVREYELGWYRYVKAFDAHHGPGGSPERDVRTGSFVRGLQTWLETRCLRGYTLGDEVYVCPNAPRVVRVHQAGHAPAFGGQFPTLVRPRREDGGLEYAPLHTFDVMLPGRFPHTIVRLRDPRGLTDAYEGWLTDGRLRRIEG